MAEKTPSDCLAILLLGKTGQGKSSTGNKLLKAGGESVLRENNIKEFEVGLEAASCTAEVRSVRRPRAGEARAIQVVDTPGFADSKAVKEFGVYKANLATLRDLIRKPINDGSRIDRVLYFLPNRGALERADGVLQEEIMVMHHFFGNAIFDCMVVVATLHHRKQDQPFDEQDIEETKKVFEYALKSASLVGGPPKCPPVIFIKFEEHGMEIQRKIETAHVESNEGIILTQFAEGTCSRCASKYIYHDDGKPDDDPNKRKGVVAYEGGKEEKIVDFYSSKCHPLFVPKFSVWEKMAGGAGHVATLGIPMLAKKLRKREIPWPTFNSKDEMCEKCHQSIGSEGCTKLHTKYKAILKIDKVPILVEHTNSFGDEFFKKMD